MKTLIYIFNMFLMLGLSYHLKAQEVENPIEELVDKDWYLTKLVIDEEEMPFISNEEVEQSLLSISDFGLIFDGVGLAGVEVLYCDYGSSNVFFYEENDNEFYFDIWIELAWTLDVNSYCNTSENNTFHDNLFINFGIIMTIF